MKVRYRVILIVVLVAVILVIVRIKYISRGQERSEALETRLILEAMEGQDMSVIREEIDLRQSLLRFEAGGLPEQTTAEAEE